MSLWASRHSPESHQLWSVGAEPSTSLPTLLDCCCGCSLRVSGPNGFWTSEPRHWKLQNPDPMDPEVLSHEPSLAVHAPSNVKALVDRLGPLLVLFLMTVVSHEIDDVVVF